MTNKKILNYKLLVTSFALALALSAVAIYPPIVPVLLPILVALSVYLMFKGLAFAALFAFLCLIIAAIAHSDILIYFSLAPFALSVVLTYGGLKHGYRFCAAISAVVLCSSLLVLAVGFSRAQSKTIGELAAEYVDRPNDAIMVSIASDAYERHLVNSQQDGEKTTIPTFTKQEALAYYTEYIRKTVDTQAILYLMGYASLLALIATLLTRELVKLEGKEVCEKKGFIFPKEKIGELTLPRRYGMRVFVPLLLFDLFLLILGGSLSIYSQSLFYAFAIVPFGFQGMTYSYFLISLIQKKPIKIVLFVLLALSCLACLFVPSVFTVFALVGAADYMANVRKIITIIKKN